EPGGAADDQVDRPGPARLQDFPAAVRVAETSLERPRPGHGLLACRAADAENLQLEPVTNRGGPVLCGNRTSSDSHAAAPASRQRPRAGRESGAQPRAHEADLGPWQASKSQ